MISATEIILIVIGFMAIVVGFVMPASGPALPERRRSRADTESAKKDVEELVRNSVAAAREQIQMSIDDTLEESLLKTERSMERIMDEKMSAISDYADTVLGDIHKNHDEVMFMYDMLNDKHKNLTGLVSEVSRTAQEAKQTVLDAELTAKEARSTVSWAADNARTVAGELQTAARLATATVPEHVRAAQPSETREKEEFSSLTEAFPEVKPEEGAHVISSKVVPIDSGRDAAHERQQAALAAAATETVSEGTLAVAPISVEAPLPQDRHAQIIEMHNAGKSNVVIARELNMGVGEVRLILDLFGKGKRARRG